MPGFVQSYFRFSQLGTNYRQEIVAGLTTFATMAYVVVINPRILETAGIWVLAIMSALSFFLLPLLVDIVTFYPLH